MIDLVSAVSKCSLDQSAPSAVPNRPLCGRLEAKIATVMEVLRAHGRECASEIGRLIIDYSKALPNRARDKECRALIYGIDRQPQESPEPDKEKMKLQLRECVAETGTVIISSALLETYSDPVLDWRRVVALVNSLPVVKTLVLEGHVALPQERLNVIGFLEQFRHYELEHFEINIRMLYPEGIHDSDSKFEAGWAQEVRAAVEAHLFCHTLQLISITINCNNGFQLPELHFPNTLESIQINNSRASEARRAEWKQTYAPTQEVLFGTT